MTVREFQDALDDALLKAFDRPADQSLDDCIPASLRDQAERDPRCAQILHDCLFIHRAIANCESPTAPLTLCENVVTRLRAPAEPTRVHRAWTEPLRVAIGLAACLLVAILALPKPKPGENLVVNEPASSADVTDLDESLLDAGAGYLALAKNLAEAMPSPIVDSQFAVAAPFENATRFGRVFEESTEKAVKTGKEIGTTLRPLTESASGAFEFLWRDLFHPEEPAT